MVLPKLFTLVLGLSAVLSCYAHPKPARSLIANPFERRSASKLFANTTPVSLARRQNNIRIPVDVWFHVVREDETVEGGNIPQDRLDAQWTVLRSIISTLDVDLTLRGTTRTTNATWHNWGSNTAYFDMARALHKGNFRTLNIYFVGVFTGGTTYPFSAVGAEPGVPVPEFPTADEQLLDGVRISHKTVPGGPGPGPGQGEGWTGGKTAVHEVGHWLSLYHTFDSCDTGPNGEGGDWVGDTPQSSVPTFYCRGDPRNEEWQYHSCSEEDLDPHENPMAYFDDACKDDYFTPGQAQRVHALWPRIRGKYPKIT